MYEKNINNSLQFLKNLQVTDKILEKMIYTHVKSRKKLGNNNLKDDDFKKAEENLHFFLRN